MRDGMGFVLKDFKIYKQKYVGFIKSQTSL